MGGSKGTSREEQVGKLPLRGNAAAKKPWKEKKVWETEVLRIKSKWNVSSRTRRDVAQCRAYLAG